MERQTKTTTTRALSANETLDYLKSLVRIKNDYKYRDEPNAQNTGAVRGLNIAIKEMKDILDRPQNLRDIEGVPI